MVKNSSETNHSGKNLEQEQRQPPREDEDHIIDSSDIMMEDIDGQDVVEITYIRYF
jgi:hypothetical protein